MNFHWNKYNFYEYFKIYRLNTIEIIEISFLLIKKRIFRGVNQFIGLVFYRRLYLNLLKNNKNNWQKKKKKIKNNILNLSSRKYKKN